MPAAFNAAIRSAAIPKSLSTDSESRRGSGAALVKVGSLLLVLVLVQPWIAVILVAAGSPLLFLELRSSGRHYRAEWLNTRRRRWTRYYISQFTQHRLAASAQILNLLVRHCGGAPGTPGGGGGDGL